MEQLAYLVVLLCALVALNWRFLGFDRLIGGARRPCRWSLVRPAGDDEYALFQCAKCGEQAHTRDGQEPNRCMRRGGG